MLVVKVFVLDSPPAGYHQTVGIVLGSRNILDISSRHHGAFEVACPAFDQLCAVVGELTLVLVEVDGVAHYSADGRGRYDVRVKAVLIESLFLFQSRSVSHIHSLADSPFDIVVVWRQIEEILMKQLNVRPGLHCEVGFELRPLCEKWYIPVENNKYE